MTKRGVMTKKESKEKRMNDIVTAAVAEFLEKGYENASMQGIAQRAGLSKGGLYHHFSGKDELLMYANKQLSEPVGEMVMEALREQSAAKALRGYIRRYISFWSERPREVVFFFLTMTKLLDMTDARAMFAGYYRDLKKTFAHFYRKGMQNGEFGPLDPEAQALALMSALDGALGILLIDGQMDAAATVASFERVFVDGLRAPQSGKGKKEDAP